MQLQILFREEIEKQKARERYMRLQEQGKTDQAKKDLGKFEVITPFSSIHFSPLAYALLFMPEKYVSHRFLTKFIDAVTWVAIFILVWVFITSFTTSTFLFIF